MISVPIRLLNINLHLIDNWKNISRIVVGWIRICEMGHIVLVDLVKLLSCIIVIHVFVQGNTLD